MSIIIKVTKDSIYCYVHPDESLLALIESKFDVLSDKGFALKTISEEDYEKEIEIFNAEKTGFEADMIDVMAIELSQKFTDVLNS